MKSQLIYNGLEYFKQENNFLITDHVQDLPSYCFVISKCEDNITIGVKTDCIMNVITVSKYIKFRKDGSVEIKVGNNHVDPIMLGISKNLNGTCLTCSHVCDVVYNATICKGKLCSLQERRHERWTLADGHVEIRCRELGCLGLIGICNNKDVCRPCQKKKNHCE